MILHFFLASAMLSNAISLPLSTDPRSASVNKMVLLQLVNNARKKGRTCGDTYYAAAPAITWNDQLETAASVHSSDMAQNNYFSHRGKNGETAGDRITDAGYNWKSYGENIAQGYATEKEVVEGWLSSPGHCANIMTKTFTEMGVAKAGSYWTQTFASK